MRYAKHKTYKQLGHIQTQNIEYKIQIKTKNKIQLYGVQEQIN